jgi:hypothetical protein
MKFFVNYNNINSLLTGVATNLKTKLNAVGLSTAEQAALNTINKLITSGNGSTFLADDGNYKTIPFSSLSTLNTELTSIFTLLGIPTDNSTWDSSGVTLPNIDKVNNLILNGDGNSLLCDDGTYQEYMSGGYPVISDTDTTSLINDIISAL